MGNETYKRGQVEWALWRAFTLARGQSDGPPPIFKTRIKRLLDLDREAGPDQVGADAPASHAFVAPAGGGSGVETPFAALDVFCLGLALDLLDVGFKQSEIVQVMRHLRADLDAWFPRLIARPSLIDRQNRLAKSHPDLPVIERSGRAPLVDARVFLVLNRIEMTEVLSAPGIAAREGQPVFLVPEFCAGLCGLQERLGVLMPMHRRTVIVVEIAALAQAVTALLGKAPLVPRGRPRNRQT